MKTILDYILCLTFIIRAYPKEGKFLPKFSEILKGIGSVIS